MNYKIKHIIVFILLIFLSDFILGTFLSNSVSKIKTGTLGIVNNSINSKADILILGSSRARHHYVPEILEDQFEMGCYNSGSGGYGLFFNYAILSERIKKQKPKIVILDIAPNIIVDKQSYAKLNVLLPFYKKYESFDEVIKLDPDFSNIKVISKAYRYNSILYDMISSKYFNKSIDNNGYLPLKEQIDKSSYKPFYLTDEKLDKNQLDYLEKIIQICKEHHIKLIGCISPTYEKFDKDNKIVQKITTVFKNAQIPLFDYSSDQKFYKKEHYFKDQLHLNDLGARAFTLEISKKIQHDL